MNKYFKLSLLDMVILSACNKEQIYGYDLSQKVYHLLSIKEGITFPEIKRLVNEGLMSISYQDSKKYYHITEDGLIKLNKEMEIYQDITHRINQFMKGLM